MDSEEAIRRAGRAAQIMDEPLVREAIDGITNYVENGWRESAVDDAAGREEFYRLLLAVKMFKSFFQTVIDGGKIAQANKPGEVL